MTVLYFAALTVCGVARKLTRWLRFRWAHLRHAPVPRDGEPLRGGEVGAFAEIMRGCGRTAREPEYDRRGSS
jgi:hypothetical protein